MRVKNTTPRTVVGSNGRGKSEEQIQANYNDHYSKKYDFELLQKISSEEQNRQAAKLAPCVARSLDGRANGGGHAY